MSVTQIAPGLYEARDPATARLGYATTATMAWVYLLTDTSDYTKR